MLINGFLDALAPLLGLSTDVRYDVSIIEYCGQVDQFNTEHGICRCKES